MGPVEREEEFDPTEYPPEIVEVETTEGIQSILLKVEEALERTPNLVLAIPRGAHAFHTTHDFLALGKIQWTREVRISIATLDPTISSLARVLGFHVEDAPSGELDYDDTLSEDVDEEREGRNNVEKPTEPLPLANSGELPDWVIVSNHRTGNLTTSTWLNRSASSDTGAPTPSQPLPEAPRPAKPQSRSGMPPPRTRPRQTGYLAPALVTDTSLHPIAVEEPEAMLTPVTSSGRIKARQVIVGGNAYQNGRGFKYGSLSRPVRWGRFLGLVTALLVLSLIAGSAYAYVYLPEGTVAVTPQQPTIPPIPLEIAVLTAPAASMTTAQPALIQPDDTEPVTASPISATLVQAPLVEEGSRATTGTRQIAKGRGRGTVRFANKTARAVAVPVGAQLKATNGVIVQTTQGGTVAATAFLGGSVGTLDLPVEATVDGPDGNIPNGQVIGSWGSNALDYVNITPLQGGAIETVKTVTQEDIDKLQADLQAQAEGKVGSAIVAAIPEAHILITQTVSMTNGGAFEADRKAGEDGDTVYVKWTGQAQAYAYSEEALKESVHQAVLDWVPGEFETIARPSTDMNSIAYEPPVVQSVEEGRVVLTTQASARVLFSLTPDLERQIRELVKGKNVKQAHSLIVQQFGTYVRPQTVQAKVLWFNVDNLPSDPARIEIESSSGPGLGPGDGNSNKPSPQPQQQSGADPRSRQP